MKLQEAWQLISILCQRFHLDLRYYCTCPAGEALMQADHDIAYGNIERYEPLSIPLAICDCCGPGYDPPLHPSDGTTTETTPANQRSPSSHVNAPASNATEAQATPPIHSPQPNNEPSASTAGSTNATPKTDANDPLPSYEQPRNGTRGSASSAMEHSTEPCPTSGGNAEETTQSSICEVASYKSQPIGYTQNGTRSPHRLKASLPAQKGEDPSSWSFGATWLAFP